MPTRSPVAIRKPRQANLLTQATEAINALNVDGCTDDTLTELVQLRDAADVVIKQVETTMKSEPQRSPSSAFQPKTMLLSKEQRNP